jgi:hypothetical protein
MMGVNWQWFYLVFSKLILTFNIDVIDVFVKINAANALLIFILPESSSLVLVAFK